MPQQIPDCLLATRQRVKREVQDDGYFFVGTLNDCQPFNLLQVDLPSGPPHRLFWSPHK
jgi:hypothetical protein